MTTQPILVMMSYRGGDRLKRCLESIAESRHQFSRVILSITSNNDSDDMRQAKAFRRTHPDVEVICTESELSTMKHQAFWITYLRHTGVQSDDWIFWLAYDDQIRPQGITKIVDSAGNWPLSTGTIYLGPWSVRHETTRELWTASNSDFEEIWTCLPTNASSGSRPLEWIAEQLINPTYIQMSGSVASLACHDRLVTARPRKQRPMRIEMATAAHYSVNWVTEFKSPLTYVYGRSDSDRSAYGRKAYLEDLNLAIQILRDSKLNKRSLIPLIDAVRTRCIQMLTKTSPREEWRVWRDSNPMND